MRGGAGDCPEAVRRAGRARGPKTTTPHARALSLAARFGTRQNHFLLAAQGRLYLPHGLTGVSTSQRLSGTVSGACHQPIPVPQRCHQNQDHRRRQPQMRITLAVYDRAGFCPQHLFRPDHRRPCSGSGKQRHAWSENPIRSRVNGSWTKKHVELPEAAFEESVRASA